MNYIIEGCDCTGKTTLFNYMLKNGYALVGTHCNPPKTKEKARKEYEGYFNVLNNGNDYVFDRLALGECVYAPMMRGYYPEYMRELEKTLKPHTILILLTANLETVKQRFDGKFLTEDQLQECLQRYDNEFEFCNYPRKIRIDTTNKSVETIMEYVIFFIKSNASIMHV